MITSLDFVSRQGLGSEGGVREVEVVQLLQVTHFRGKLRDLGVLQVYHFYLREELDLFGQCGERIALQPQLSQLDKDADLGRDDGDVVAAQVKAA